MTVLDILVWVVFGLIAGALAQFLMPGRDPGQSFDFKGFVITTLLGIAGAFVGGYIGNALGLAGAVGQEARGLLERRADDSDARIWRLHLTREGDKLARRALAVQIEVVTAMGEGSSAADNARLVASLDRVSAILQAMD